MSWRAVLGNAFLSENTMSFAATQAEARIRENRSHYAPTDARYRIGGALMLDTNRLATTFRRNSEMSGNFLFYPKGNLTQQLCFECLRSI